MSSFEIIKLSQSELVKVKPIDKRWENFPHCSLNEEMVPHLSKVKHFKIFDDDILLTGYPRSGTTFTAELLWLLVNNFDFDQAKSVPTDTRLPLLEFSYDSFVDFILTGRTINTFESMSRPRTIKSHLPVQLLPDEVWVKKPKIINISRDPHDVAISIYHLDSHSINQPLTSSLERFLNDDRRFCPYREHRLNYWNIPDYPNILYLTYEWATSNVDDVIKKVADFVGATISDENFIKLKNHLQFNKMKGNEACNFKQSFEAINKLRKLKTNTDDFIRRGKIGGFKDEMPDEYIEKFDKWIAEESTLEAGFPRKNV